METSLIEIIKLAFIIGGPIATICWHLYKKMETKIEKIEVKHEAQDNKFDAKIEMQGNRMSELEKALLEMRTEFKFTSRDIKEMREMMEKYFK